MTRDHLLFMYAIKSVRKGGHSSYKESSPVEYALRERTIDLLDERIYAINRFSISGLSIFYNRKSRDKICLAS
jgi:hypothetical protein